MSAASGSPPAWPFLRFGLLVTGEAEEAHAHMLFRSLEATGICNFAVIRRVNQLRPRTSARRLKVTGTTQPVTKRAEEEISFPTRRHLRESVHNFVILLDDLEHDSRTMVREVCKMYRKALDHVLKQDEPSRASMHFLVNMLEAYYFGDPDAVNAVLALNPPLAATEEDVEEIRNPKAVLKQLFPRFHEIDHGGEILALLDVTRVLANPENCAFLRTLFAWCVKVLERHPHWEDVAPTSDLFHLSDGIMSYVTGAQIGNS